MSVNAGLCVPFVAAFGAVVGSFLNVVIHRLPRGMSVARPRRSFCPACEQSIRAGDNIPVFSWLRLSGRCRSCRNPIPIRYPIVELLAVLVCVMTWDALVIGGVLRDVSASASSVPLVFGYGALFVGLVAASAMDVEDYLIDVRVTNLLMGIGIAAHALRGLMAAAPAQSGFGPASASAALAAALAWGLTALWLARRENEPSDSAGDSPMPEEPPEASPTPGEQPSVVVSWPVWLLLLAVASVAALTAWGWGREGLLAFSPSQQRAFAGVFILMVVLIAAGMSHRPADVEIMQTLQREQPRARHVALVEFTRLLPAVLAAVAVFVALRARSGPALEWNTLAPHLGPRLAATAAGAGQALAATLLAAAIGWTVRIVFTLAFGKEAYGVGDIYLMAAIGAVAGPWLVAISFFLGAMLALVGAAAFWLRKGSRALPFGPWLSLGALAGLWVHDALVRAFQQSWYGLQTLWSGR